MIYEVISSTQLVKNNNIVVVTFHCFIYQYNYKTIGSSMLFYAWGKDYYKNNNIYILNKNLDRIIVFHVSMIFEIGHYNVIIESKTSH